MLSLAYRLERLVDALIVWHFFRDREDGMAGVFEEAILHDGGLGLDRKVKLARKIAEEWLYGEEEDPAGYVRLVNEAKFYRDCVAHWPTRLQPLVDDSDNPVDFIPFIEKGSQSFALSPALRDEWLATADRASSQTQGLIDRISEHCRLGLE